MREKKRLAVKSYVKYGSKLHLFYIKDMSKIGRKPIAIPDGVQVQVQDGTLQAKGPKGELSVEIHEKVKVEKQDDSVVVSVGNPENRSERELWGTFRVLVSNVIEGVAKGFEKKLEINGVGYRAQINGDTLELNVGYSHPIHMEIPKELEVKVEKNVITINGIDKQLVGQFAAEVRATRKPEPYKGKGIKYSDEVIRRKAGKVVKAVGGE